MIKNYYQYITEGRQRGALYHVLSIDSLKYVIENDSIKGHHYSFTISTTRNKMLNSYVGSRPDAFFKLELDGDKIAQNYKIKPFVYRSATGVRLEEQEEQVKTREIKPASKYITKVIIMKGKMENARLGWRPWEVDVDEKKPSVWFTSDVKAEKSMQGFIKWLKENSPAPIYIQDGSKIYQDDEYLDLIINEPVYQIDYGYTFYYRGRTKPINNDIFTQKEALFPLDERNETIVNPVVGYNYENLWLMTKEEAISKMEEYSNKDMFNQYEERTYSDGEKWKEKNMMYFCKFELYNQELLPKDGHVKKAKLDDMTPAEWIYDRISKKKAA
jgi:hypothetical protein